MTDALSGTDMASVPAPAGATGFGGIEVAYLIARHQGPSTNQTSAVLPFPASYYSDDMQTAAISTLLARGYLDITGTSLQSRSGAALLEFAAARSSKWIQFGQFEPDRGYAALLRSNEVTALLDYYAYDAWHCTFADHARDLEDSVLAMFDDRLATSAEGAGYLNVFGLLENDRAYSLTRSGADQWHLSVSEHETGETTNSTVNRAELRGLVTDILTAE